MVSFLKLLGLSSIVNPGSLTTSGTLSGLILSLFVYLWERIYKFIVIIGGTVVV